MELLKKEGEDVTNIVCKVSEVLEVQLTKEDIQAAHRVPTKKPSVPRPIVVQLSSRRKRDEIL